MEKHSHILTKENIIKYIMDNSMEPMVVVDSTGYIVLFNQAYAEFLDIKIEDAVGRHVTKVIENTRMHIVIKTGVSEIGDIQRVRGHTIVCKRFVIKEGRKIIGAIGTMMFKDLSDMKFMTHKLSQLEGQLKYYKDQLEKHEESSAFDKIIGNSDHIKELKSKTKMVAKTKSTVLVRGESGTGKELFARSIHELSKYKKGPFIKVNCAAIPEHLLESELFGYEEGAFTGAKRGGKPGKFQLANNGTIFLDEIGDMPLNMQVKLLRVLQEREIERIGSEKSIPVNLRVVAATNNNLEEMVKEGKFRLDLFYRLNVIELKISPLRNRKDDIPLLVNYFLGKICEEMDKNINYITQDALEILINYEWPGNIRELINTIERAVIFAEKGKIDSEQLKFSREIKMSDSLFSSFNIKESVKELEKKLIIEAMRHTEGNKMAAAKLLGVSRAQFYNKLNNLTFNSNNLDTVKFN